MVTWELNLEFLGYKILAVTCSRPFATTRQTRQYLGGQQKAQNSADENDTVQTVMI